MQLVVVGSGTAVPHPERVGSAHYVEAVGARVILDCGPGAVHHLARFRLPWPELTHVLLSHFHTDHIADVPTLLFGLKHGLEAPRETPLEVIGPPGTRELLDRFAAAYGDYVLEPGFDLRVREAAPPTVLELCPGVLARVIATPHTPESQGYRIETRGAALGYTGDTGFGEELAGGMEGVDVLLTECSLPDDSGMESHLTPSTAAALARIARPRQLLLTHLYPQVERQDVPALVRSAGWDGPVRVVHDGLRVSL